MMKMDPENKRNSKTLSNNRKQEDQKGDTKREKVEGLSYKQVQKKVVKVLQIMGKKMSCM